MFRTRMTSIILITICCLSFSSCAAYYKVTDTNSGKVYYTQSVKKRSSGLVTFKDSKTGATVNIPASEVRVVSKDTYTEGLKAALTKRWPEHRLMIFGHLGDGNLHVIVSVGDDSEEAHHAVEEVVYSGVRDLNGSVSAEHGIGLEKRDYLNWIQFVRRMDRFFPKIRVMHPYPLVRFDARTQGRSPVR